MKTIKLALLVLAFAVLVSAAPPAATVTSSAPFDLAGNRVNVGGVPSWTVMSGDDIATGSAQATIQLRDGSRVVLLPASRARITSDSDGFSVRLLSGALEVLSALPDFRLFVPDGQASVVPGGVVTAGTSAAAPGKTTAPLKPLIPKPVSRI